MACLSFLQAALIPSSKAMLAKYRLTRRCLLVSLFDPRKSVVLVHKYEPYALDLTQGSAFALRCRGQR